MQVHSAVSFVPGWIVNSEIERENVQNLQKQLGTDLPVLMEANRAPGKGNVSRKKSSRARAVSTRMRVLPSRI
jgi:hypothetical protein